MNSKYLLIGYYGYANLGDEWVLNETVRSLRSIKKNAEIYVLYGPKGRPPKGTTVLSRKSFFKACWTLMTCNGVIFGGGSVFQDVSSSRSFWFYATWLYLAQILNKKTILLGQGIGPLKKPRHQAVLAKLLKRCSGLSVRDPASYDWLQERGISSIQGADLSMLTQPVQSKENNLSQDKIEGVGVSLRSGFDTDTYQLILKILQQQSSKLYFYVFQPEDQIYATPVTQDKEMDLTLLNLDKINQDPPFQAMVGMRFHACLYAAHHSRPFLGLAYDPKVLALCKLLNQPYIDLTNGVPKPESVSKAIVTFLQSISVHHKNLDETLPPYRRSAQKHVDLFKQVL